MANHKKQRNKKKPEEIAKMQARFDMKFEEFSKIDDLDELKRIFNEEKMSANDRDALVNVVRKLMQKEAGLAIKKAQEDGKKDGKQDEPGTPGDTNKDNK